MPKHKPESDADLTTHEPDGPQENAAGATEVPDVDADTSGMSPADPGAAAGAVADEPLAVQPQEAGEPVVEEAPAEASEEEPGADRAASEAAAGTAADEPPTVEAEEAGESADEEAPAEASEQEPGADEAAPVAAAGAAADEPPAVEAQEAGEGAEEAEPAEAIEEEPGADVAASVAAAGAAADEPPTVQPAEAGETVEEEAPAEAEEAGETEAEAAPAAVEGEAVAAAATAAGVAGTEDAAALALQRRKRQRLLVGLLVLIALLIAAGVLFGRYLLRPGPLPDLLPLPVSVNYRPHYLFSIYGVERPVGVAVSPDGQRIYVTETGGEREIKVFDRDGNLLHTFSPPRTQPAERAPVYVAVGPTGRVFVSDRLQRAVFVYDSDGNLLDAIIGPGLTLTEYGSEHVGALQPDGELSYNLFEGIVRFQTTGGGEQVLPAPDPAGWAPLGVRVNDEGTMFLTNVAEGHHCVCELPADLVLATTWQEFDPSEFVFGVQGHNGGQLMFPNSAVSDSQGRIFVTDGNNGRISVWDAPGSFLFDFGRGVGESALSLPRGAAMDERDRLHVVDAVQQCVKVYDVSETEPRFLFTFGDWGTADGEFNYPGDIALDDTGRLYIADRENNRIQVWSY